MKTLLKSACLLRAMTTVACTGALPVSAANRTSEGSTLYAADFAKDEKAWTVVSGTFKAENGVYRSRSLGPDMPLSRAIAGNMTWKNYSVETRLKLAEWAPPVGADFGIIARYQDPGNYYIFLYKRDSKTMVIERKREGKLLVLKEAPFDLQPGKWHHFQANLAGRDLSVAIDGKKLVQISDDNFSQGGAGLLAFWADIHCDRFIVKKSGPHPDGP
ncbi:MAG: hypothetical protein Q7S40_17485 [Opitutaceae bacterium]|nr:hypothetical protein [Opitutaceae bacterium]